MNNKRIQPVDGMPDAQDRRVNFSEQLTETANTIEQVVKQLRIHVDTVLKNEGGVTSNELLSLQRELSDAMIALTTSEAFKKYQPLAEDSVRTLQFTYPNAFKIFARLQITTLTQLTNTTAEQLLAEKNCGPTVLESIRNQLANKGLYLQGENPEESTTDDRVLQELLPLETLSSRLSGALQLRGITTYGQLIQRYTKSQLSQAHGVGEVAMKELQALLDEKGVKMLA